MYPHECRSLILWQRSRVYFTIGTSFFILSVSIKNWRTGNPLCMGLYPCFLWQSAVASMKKTNVINQLSLKFPLIIFPYIYSCYIWHHIPWLHFPHGGETMFITCRLVCIPALVKKVVTVKHWKMYGCVLKCLDSQRFKPVDLNIDSWALPVLTLENFNLIVLFTRVGVTCTILQYDVSAIESDIWYSVSVSWG